MTKKPANAKIDAIHQFYPNLLREQAASIAILETVIAELKKGEATEVFGILFYMDDTVRHFCGGMATHNRHEINGMLMEIIQRNSSHIVNDDIEEREEDILS